MATTFSSTTLLALALALFTLLTSAAHGTLSPSFYNASCPKLQTVVRAAMVDVVRKEPRMAASILRLFFHDCFPNGCDGSILLDETPKFLSEKNAAPNFNSVRGFDVIDAIKSKVEKVCRATVSCADIVALATRDGVNLLGGPSWTVELGRRDSLTANMKAANEFLPGPSSDLAQLLDTFNRRGFTARDVTALSGAHTIGHAHCGFFADRMMGDASIDSAFASLLQQNCSLSAGGGAAEALAPLDRTPKRFDNAYYRDLIAHRVLFHSDQELFNNGPQDSLVRQYSADGTLFAADFAAAMVKMGRLNPLSGTSGQIRLHCSRVN
ncbi:Peroxidase 4 [Ananas comosus]|uniref:Peroxidase n=1 Tax=Ananas comosus TaxID=4615 RepID=A0A199W7G6_ANACO|nr:Peroxidase 4 [Ananas comosus]